MWFRLRDLAIVHLISCARERKLTTYGGLWDAIQTMSEEDIGRRNRHKDRHLAGAVAVHVHEAHEPMLTSLIVHDADGYPGRGFFSLAAEQGLLPAKYAPREDEIWALTPHQRRFWENQRDAVFAQYAE